MSKFRKPILLILLLAFTGQVIVANALPCQMPLNNQASTAASDMAAIDHSAHHMPAGAAQAADNTGGENCCDMGVCAMSHCQSAVTLPLDYFASSAEFTPVFSRHNSAATPSGVNDSLYRPPISR
jgi:hypothetical protein